MRMILREKSVRAVVAALYAAAMLALGGAHLGPAMRAVAPDSIVVASLSDGTPVVLCLSEASQQGRGAPDKAPRQDHSCAACRLTAAPGVAPAPPQDFALDRVVGARIKIAQNLAGAAKSVALAPQSRGPPAA